MNAIYNRILKSRLDMTEWLIHFTRDKDGIKARDILLNIIREGAIRPGRSLRKGKPTIYGGSPAICFTEQPLNHFLQYVNSRDNSRFVAPYGILIHKHSIFSLGGRPVIYGWDKVLMSNEDQRIIDEKHIPLEEQYRYVVFNPTNNASNIDWSHEREWRWRSDDFRGSDHEEIQGSLSLWLIPSTTRSPINKQSVHILVKTEDDIEWLQYQASQFFDEITKKDIKTDYENNLELWHKKMKKSTKIISLEQVEKAIQSGRPELGRFEGWLEYWKAQQDAEQQSSSES